MSPLVLIQFATMLIFPIIAIWLSKKYRLAAFLSPIVLCFACGIIFGNLQFFRVDTAGVDLLKNPAILLSLPLLLFSSDIKQWITNSRHLIYGYLVAATVTVIAVSFTSICFHQFIPEIWHAGGMMTGIHTGGTPNLYAVAAATGTNDTVTSLTQSAQIFFGGIHLLFLLSVGHMVYEYVLGSSPKSPIEIPSGSYVKHSLINVRHVLFAIALASAILWFSLFTSDLLFGKIHETYVIVSVTTLGIVSSLFSQVRMWQGSFEAGDYLLLVFSVGVGMLSDMRVLMENGGIYLGFVGVIFILSVMLMLILSRLFSIKKDHAMIASTAAIYGPVFIPQVAQVLRNRSIIPGGIAISLIGLALGNYIGLGMFYLLKSLLE